MMYSGNSLTTLMWNIVNIIFWCSINTGIHSQNIYISIQEEIQKENAVPNWVQRWEYFNAKRVDSDGRFPDMKKLYDQIKSTQQIKQNSTSQKVSDNIEWVPYGPFSLADSINDPYQQGIGRINCITFHPSDTNIFYIGSSQGGVWKTIDNGSSWMPITEMLPILRISDIALDHNHPDTMYACLGDYAYLGVGLETDERKRNTHYGMGVYKTIDGGNNWDATGLSFENTDFDGSLMRRVFVHSANADELVAVGTSGIWKSYDGGVNWNHVLDSLIWDAEQSFHNPNVLFASTGYSVKLNMGYASILKSEDFGETWLQLNTAIPPKSVQRVELALSPTDSNYIYAATCDTVDFGAFYGVYRSVDGGETWELRSTVPNILGSSPSGGSFPGQGSYDLCVLVDGEDKDNITVGGINLWVSDDGGSSWSSASYWLNFYGESIHADQHQLKQHPITKQIYLCNDGGLYRTDSIKGVEVINDGYTTLWENLSNGMNISSFYKLDVFPSNSQLVVAGAQDNATFYFDGMNWRKIFSGDGMDCAFDPLNHHIIYGSRQRGSIYKTFDEGQNYDLLINGIGAWTTPIQVDPIDNNILYVAMDQLYKSTNAGNDWEIISAFEEVTELEHALEASAMRVPHVNTNYIYIAKRPRHSVGENSELWITQNGGLSWQDISTGLPIDQFITSIEVDEFDPGHVWISFAGFLEGEKVYESTDAGLSWVNISNGLPNVPVNAIVQQTSASTNTLFVGTDLGVFIREGENGQWQPLGSGLPNVIVSDLAYHELTNILFVATFGRGIWSTYLDPMVSKEEYSEEGGINVVPNPSNGNFYLEGVQLDKYCNYELIDITGKIIDTQKLTNNVRLKLTTGIYWLKILSCQDQQMIEVKRIVVQ